MMTKDLLLSILAMDAYNQGAGSGINHGETQIGLSATLLELSGRCVSMAARLNDKTTLQKIGGVPLSPDRLIPRPL